MDFSKLEFLLNDDTADFKKMLDNFMHFPPTKLMNESKEDEEILLSCMKYAFKAKGDGPFFGENKSRRRPTTLSNREHKLPYLKKHLPEANTNGSKVKNTISSEYVETVYKDKSEKDFFSELKVTKRSFGKILNEISSTDIFSRECISGPSATKPEIALEIFLTYLSKKSTFKTLSSKFHLSESAIMGNFARCVAAINSLQSKYIKWYEDEEISEVEGQFDRISGLRGVLGSLGTCCIEMRTIKEPPAGYKIGRQKSIMYLLGVADADTKFKYIQVGYPATFAPQEALEASSLGEDLSDPESTIFPSDEFHMIAASHNFILHENLLTPFEDPINSHQEDFNERLQMCDTIERAFIHLKCRFCVLGGQIFSSLEKIPNIVKSCCIVHNICVDDINDQKFLKCFISTDFTDYSKFIDDSDFYPIEQTSKAILKRDTIVSSLVQ